MQGRAGRGRGGGRRGRRRRRDFVLWARCIGGRVGRRTARDWLRCMLAGALSEAARAAVWVGGGGWNGRLDEWRWGKQAQLGRGTCYM